MWAGIGMIVLLAANGAGSVDAAEFRPNPRLAAASIIIHQKSIRGTYRANRSEVGPIQCRETLRLAILMTYEKDGCYPNTPERGSLLGGGQAIGTELFPLAPGCSHPGSIAMPRLFLFIKLAY